MEALDRLALRVKHYKWNQIALFGAGQHTQRFLDDLPVRVPGLRVLCILDDQKAGGTLANIPIVSPSEWKRFPVQAVVISSDAHEERLYQKMRAMNPLIPIVRFYADTWPGTNAATNGVLDEICNLPANLHDAGVMMSRVLEAMVRHAA